jgi:hypothetical protein
MEREGSSESQAGALPEEAVIELRWRGLRDGTLWVVWLFFFAPGACTATFGTAANGLTTPTGIAVVATIAFVGVIITLLMVASHWRRRKRLLLSRRRFAYDDGATVKSAPWGEIAEIQMVHVPWWSGSHDFSHVSLPLRGPHGWPIRWVEIPDMYTVRHSDLVQLLRAWHARALADPQLPEGRESAEARRLVEEEYREGFRLAAAFALFPLILLLGTLLWLFL